MANWRTEIKSFFEKRVSIALNGQIKKFGAWNAQKSNSDIEETAPEMAVYFEYSEVGEDLEYLLQLDMQQSARIPVQVTLHVVFDNYNETAQDRAYQYAELITCNLVGLKHSLISGRIMKVSENEDSNHRAQYGYQISFAFWIKEIVFKAIESIDGNPATGENPATGRKLFLKLSAILEKPTPENFTLNISSDGNGTTTPATGSYEIESGTYQEIEGIPDEGNKFDNFDIDGDIITDNPYQLLMNSAKNVVAFFSSLVEVFYQTIFTGAEDEIEELTGGGYGFKNYGTGDIEQPIGNVKVAKFGDSDGVSFADYDWVIGKTIYFTIDLSIVSSTEYIITNDKESGYTDGIRYNGSTFLIKIGSFSNDLAYTSKDELVEISVVRTTTTDYVFYENGIIIGTIVMPTTNTPLLNLLGKRTGDFNFTGIMSCLHIEDYLKYNFQEGNGIKIWDSLGTGNHGTLDDKFPIDFWDYTSDQAEPTLPKEGYTLFLKDGTSDEFLRVTYANGIPQSNSESGYSYQYEVPPNSGFSNTENTINWAVDAATQAIADKYSIPYTLNYTQMAAIDFSVIDEDDLNVIHENNVFTQWNVIKE